MIALILIGCENKPKTKESSIGIFTPGESPDSGDYRKTEINIGRSVVEWKGTKLLGAGSHTGTVRFKEGFLLFDGDRLTGGEFVVDMRSIYNTDIPLNDPVPRKNITDHLNSDFETDSYPLASFEIKTVAESSTGYILLGILNIKGIKKPISVQAKKVDRNNYISEFSFNRFDWKIGENGTWLEKKLVDPEISLKVIVKI